jgi:YsiA-like protein, C-terminal region.
MRRAIQYATSSDPSTPPREKLGNLIKAHLKFNASDGYGGISIFEQRNLPPGLRKPYAALRDEYEQFFRSVLQEAMSSGQIKQDDARLQTHFILGLLNSVPHWFKQSGPLSIEEVADKICDLLFGGKSPRTNNDDK